MRGRILARTMRRPILLLVSATVLLAGVLAACGATEPLPSATRSFPPEVSSPPGGSPAGNGSGLSDFEARLRDATAREGQLVRAVAAASAGSPADLRLVIGQMRDWAAGERAWLGDHPADPCYDAAATKLRAALDAMVSSAGWLEGTVTASLAPSDDVSMNSMGTEAGNDLQDAGQALIDAAALAKAARTACG
jgi:predicted small secreted protein